VILFPPRKLSSVLQPIAGIAFAGLSVLSAYAGGPKYVGGATYFNPGVVGQPVRWANGQVSYFVDQGPLNASMPNTKAVAMVDAAAAIWSAVPTAAVSLTDQGSLAEDVNGANVMAGNGVFAQPSDVSPTATTMPVAVVFDADGSVTDALYGSGASQPDNCAENSVFVWTDSINPDATFAHAVILLNGRCGTTPNLVAMMQFQLERAFGRVLGLDLSQVNDGALTAGAKMPNGTLGWPVMLPHNGACGPMGGACIPNPAVLRYDDIAALGRLYPVTGANASNFTGKLTTVGHTVAIKGTISFRDGTGMQGVNVVARPLDANGNPLYQYTVTAVSGVLFNGNHGNPVTGFTDQLGNRFDRFGSNDTTVQGTFDLSGMPLPAGMTSASYQVSFEAINPLYIQNGSVGPYLLGSPTPSGTLQTVIVPAMQAGQSQTVNVTVSDSAGVLAQGVAKSLALYDAILAGVAPSKSLIQAAKLARLGQSHAAPGSQPRMGAVKARKPLSAGSEANPRALPTGGAWTSRIATVGQTDWYSMPVRGNRMFTIVTQALNESGVPSQTKAMPAIGVWDGFNAVGTPPVGWAPAGNGFATGETWLQVATAGDEIVRMGVADQRGDGRPDYTYRGWVLYADTVSPSRLPVGGGTIVIRGTGFRAGDTVQVGGVQAQVVSILPTEITAIVAAAGSGVTGSLDVEVDDSPLFNAAAVIPSGVSYDSGAGDALNLLTAPSNQVAMNVPQAFSVTALGSDGKPAGGVTVQYSVTSGTANLGCGQTTCSVTTTGDGRANMAVTATNTSIAVVTVSLTNGASLQAHFYGGTPSAVTALTPTLYLAAGATAQWPVQALVQSGGAPVSGQSVTWQSVTGITAPGSAVTTNAAGTAAATLSVSALAKGQMATSNACLPGGTICVGFNVFGARPEFAGLAAVNGTSQSIAASASPAAVTLRVLDMNGHPMAGGTVTVSQALYAWTPPCPAHGRCAQAQLLASQTTTSVSGLDGSITLTPLTQPGTATNLVGLAATGNAGTLTFNIEQHP